MRGSTIRGGIARRYAVLVASMAAAVLMGFVGFARGGAGRVGAIVHRGMGNASAVAIVGEGLFCAASDEENRLCIYPVDTEGPEVGSVDVSRFLQLRGRSVEADLEGAARIGDRVYWIGSHSRSKDGKWRPNRQRLFATRIVTNAAAVQLEPVGHPCASLLESLAREPGLKAFDIMEASRHAPEDGGLNIEGLAAGPDGELWLGFRSPIPGGKALLVPLLNPAEVVDLQPPRFGVPRLLDLDGLGVRDAVWTGSDWFLIAGRAGSGGNARLYRWAGGDSQPQRVEKPGFRHFNPEAIAAVGQGKSLRLLVLSDDGEAPLGMLRQFRSFWVDP